MFDAKITRFFSFSSLHSHFRTTVARTDFYFLFFAFSMRSSTFCWIDFTQTQILPNILRFFLFNFRSAWIRRIDNTNNCPRRIYSIFPSPTCVGRSMLTHRSMYIILYNLIFGAFVPISQIQIVSALRKWSVQCTHSIRSKWYEAWIKRNSISIEWIDTLSYGWNPNCWYVDSLILPLKIARRWNDWRIWFGACVSVAIEQTVRFGRIAGIDFRTYTNW